MKRKEFLVGARSQNGAFRKCLSEIEKYKKKHVGKRFEFLAIPMTKKYEGNSKKLKGKWRCYAQLGVIG